MEGFFDLVSETWQKTVSGSPFFIWEEKLRRLKVALKSWAKTQPSPISEILQAQRALGSHQLLMEEATITPEMLNMEIDLQKALHSAREGKSTTGELRLDVFSSKREIKIPLSSTSRQKLGRITTTSEKSTSRTTRLTILKRLR